MEEGMARFRRRMSCTPETVGTVARMLGGRYHDFDHYNVTDDPLEELFFILCSTKTSERTYRSTYRSLRAVYPTNADLFAAPLQDITRVLRPGGLASKKAGVIKRILALLNQQFGQLTLDPLHELSDAACERFLLSLPGVGKKVARCVMMYALHRKVFPVDEHCWRIAKRLGWIRQTRKNRSGSPRDEDRLQSKLPPEYRHSLHVNFVSLGREYCRATSPRCKECPLAALCPRVGVRHHSPL
jgi:endonuclease-3